MSTLFAKKSSRKRAKRSHKLENGNDGASFPKEYAKLALRSLSDGDASSGDGEHQQQAAAHAKGLKAGAGSRSDHDNGDDNDDGFYQENQHEASPWCTFEDLGLSPPLVHTCKSLGFARPTPVQRTLIPFLLRDTSSHVLALAATGSGKTASFVLPILQHLSVDPYDMFAVILSPTRELAKQIHQHVVALGTKSYQVQCALLVGGLDAVRQSCELAHTRPHLVVASPGRFAALLRGPDPPRLHHVRYLVLDEADRLLAPSSGFEKDVAEILLHCNHSDKVGGPSKQTREAAASKYASKCQTLLFSATMTQSLSSLEEIASAGRGRLPIKRFDIPNDHVLDDGDKDKKEHAVDVENGTTDTPVPSIPAGLKQEYIFMPSRVRDAYLLAVIRTLMSNGGRAKTKDGKSLWTTDGKRKSDGADADADDNDTVGKARSTIIFVSTCERAALVSGILTQVGVENVALHSLLTSQSRRLAALAKFQSQHVRVLVATDVASRGLDIPCVDLVVNAELPRSAVSYVHRVGRTARAGRRGRAISLVGENDVSLVHAAERVSGRPLEKCTDVTDEAAIRMLGPVTKAARLARRQLMDIGFDELVQKFKERKVRDRKERQRIEQALRKQANWQKTEVAMKE